jgi:D-sedoheptulose 7-phosphate isomerase
LSGALRPQREVVYDIASLLNATVVTDGNQCAVDIGAAVTWVVRESRRAHATGYKLIFLGVGADAGSASHMAIDFSKNGGVRAVSMTDPSAITCLGNDFGFEYVFSKQIEFYAQSGDMVIIIGGNGTSSVLLKGAEKSRELGLKLVTTTTTTTTTTTAPAGNPLRALGNLNFNIGTKSGTLGIITQLALCHSFVDFLCGWNAPNMTQQLVRRRINAQELRA